MLSKKQIKLLFSLFVVLISSVVIILSDDTSKFSDPFDSPEPTVTPDGSESIQRVFVPKAPVTASIDSESLLIEAAEPEEYVDEGFRVVKVVDGDTMDIDMDGKIERVRLIGIDTPETVDPRKPVQCFGIEASNKAKELLQGQFVILEADETQGERDKYKRLLRYVFLPDGTNFNLYMIAEGFAHEYTYDKPYKYQFDFKEAQKHAIENEKGLWSPTICSGNK